MTDEERRCTNCRHFQPHDSDELPPNPGWCMRFPPVVVSHDNPQARAMAWSFPIVHADRDWCGEFQLVEEAPSANRIEAGDLSIRARKILNAAGIRMWTALASMRESEVRELRNCGMTPIVEYRKALAARGLSFLPETEAP